MNSHAPIISVIMPVYNAEKYLAEAIESILNQSFTDFEFLIFNDGSSDNSAAIVQKYAGQDSRIVFHNYSTNTGYLKHLNEGIDKAQGKYIARMDADDISFPNRFATQFEYLEAHPDVGVCGSWFVLFEKEIINTDEIIKHSVSDFDIKIDLLYYCSLGHPTIMAKTEILKNNHYDQNFYPAEDYELWSRLASITNFYNIPEVLLYYRWHENNISKTKQEIQSDKTKKIRQRQLEQLGLAHRLEINQLSDFLNAQKNSQMSANSLSAINKVAEILPILYLANPMMLNKKSWESFLEEFWVSIIKKTFDVYDMRLLNFYIYLTLPTFSLLSFKEKISFVVKCLINWRTRIKYNKNK